MSKHQFPLSNPIIKSILYVGLMSKKEIVERISELDQLFDFDGTQDGIPLDGSLGLVAIGYKGTMAWREKKMLTNKLESLGKATG